MPNKTTSIYEQDNLKAIVQHRPGMMDYIVIAYEDAQERQIFVFDTEAEANSCADDWCCGPQLNIDLSNEE